MRTIAERIALVTGAGGGIGTAIVDRLRRDGMTVITLDVTGDVDIVADIVDGDLPSEVFDSVDVCVSNAGVVDTNAPAHSMSAAQWQRDIDVNLSGAFRVIQACLPGMRRRRYGRIVAISSLAGKTGMAGKVAYAASKAGLQAAVRTIAIENAGLGVTANCIQPGFVATPKVIALPAHAMDRLLSSIPVQRLAHPAEIADLVAFLGAESNGYITGQDIAIDGGLGLLTVTLGSGSRRDTDPR